MPKFCRNYAEYLATYGGMAACGNGLGVFVGTDIKGTPPSWAFIPMGSTVEVIREALSLMSEKGWSVYVGKEP